MSAHEQLLVAPAAVAVRKALPLAEDVWIVGGAIRDALLDREVTDLDLAVGDDPPAIAKAIAASCDGFAFELSSEFATWRAVTAGGEWHIDVAALRGDGIEADLGARDFTANATAVALHDPSSELIDPHRGAEDVRARLLRAVSAQSFDDDPLRILRAARLAAGLDFELEPGTVDLARAAAARASEVAGERQFAELRMLITGPDPVRGLRLLDELDATAGVLPELAALRGVEQNPNHHLDVYGHTLEVLRQWLELERELEPHTGELAPAIAELLAAPVADGFDRAGALRFGAILHDVGKPATRKLHEGGFVSFIGHDREGAALVAAACARLKTSRRLARHLELLTLHHLHLGFMTGERPLSRRRLYDYLRLTEPVAVDVTLLTVADRLAARGSGPTASTEMVAAHLELAREVLPAALVWDRQGPPRSPIRGDELAAAVGIEPGPELGRLLAEVEAGVFAGEVAGPEDAIALARRLRSE